MAMALGLRFYGRWEVHMTLDKLYHHPSYLAMSYMLIIRIRFEIARTRVTCEWDKFPAHVNGLSRT